MKVLIVMSFCVARFTSLSVSRIVIGLGGYAKYDRPRSKCAVGSPSEIMMIWRVPFLCFASRFCASISAWCMFVPSTDSSQRTYGSCSAFNSRAYAENPMM